MSNKRRDFFIRMIANVGIYLKKQRNITRKGDYATGIDDAQFALVVLFTASMFADCNDLDCNLVANMMGRRH